MTENEKEQYMDNRVEHVDHDNFLEEATVLVLKEMLGSDKAYTDLLTGVSDDTMFHLAYHVLQSNMYFALAEGSHDLMMSMNFANIEYTARDGLDAEVEKVLSSWDKSIDPRMSASWNALQAYYWSP